jgi:hypothetical protein
MRLKYPLYCLSICVLVFLINQPVYGFRCSGKIVYKGDTKSQVIEKCGEPDHIEYWEEERIKKDHYYSYDHYRPYEGYREPFLVEEYVRSEEWTYNRGPTAFIRYLIFENGRLKKINLGDKGYS